MLIYKAAVDISQLIKLEDAMSSLTLGPNGGLMFCMEFLEKNMDWLLQQLSNYKDHYFLFDCPGQVCANYYDNSISLFHFFNIEQHSKPLSYTQKPKRVLLNTDKTALIHF